MQPFAAIFPLALAGCSTSLAPLLDKTFLDITWLKDKSLADLDNLPDPDVLAAEIVENLKSALDGFKAIIAQLKK